MVGVAESGIGRPSSWPSWRGRVQDLFVILDPLRSVVRTIFPEDVEALIRDEVLSLYAQLDDEEEDEETPV